MVMYQKLAELESRLKGFKDMGKVFEHLRAVPSAQTVEEVRTLNGKPLRMELTDSGIYAIYQSDLTKPRDQGEFERHVKYVDFHMNLDSDDLAEWSTLDGLSTKEAYNQKDDYATYHNDKRGINFHIAPGLVAVFFPEDAHMPWMAIDGIPKRILKTVVKYPVSLL